MRTLAAAHGTAVSAAELVGLVPEAALRDFPTDLELLGDDRAVQAHALERKLETLSQ